MSVGIIDYGAGNIASISNAIKKVGGEPILISEPRSIHDFEHLVLPGVGAFGDAMKSLEPFKDNIKEYISSGNHLLGVCIGIQLFFESSRESPKAEGLGLFEGSCEKFADNLKVPHMGWNTISIERDSNICEGVSGSDHFYFVHSFYVKPKDADIIVAKTEYGIRFPSIISSQNVHATQFHPEKSGRPGLRILKNFISL